MVEIMVFQDAFTVCGRRVDVGGLDKVLRQLSVADSNQTVIVKCAWDSGHEKLIEVLNLCSEKNLSNVSVMSM
jgi:biopolymer transport protein ExbD